jgi:hypothetical protein
VNTICRNADIQDMDQVIDNVFMALSFNATITTTASDIDDVDGDSNPETSNQQEDYDSVTPSFIPARQKPPSLEVVKKYESIVNIFSKFIKFMLRNILPGSSAMTSVADKTRYIAQSFDVDRLDIASDASSASGNRRLNDDTTATTTTMLTASLTSVQSSTEVITNMTTSTADVSFVSDSSGQALSMGLSEVRRAHLNSNANPNLNPNANLTPNIHSTHGTQVSISVARAATVEDIRTNVLRLQLNSEICSTGTCCEAI